MTALDAILEGMHALARTVYQTTAREVRGIGIAVDDDTFDRAYMMFVDRQRLPDLEAQDLSQRISAAGYFDGTCNGTPVRIAREDLLLLGGSEPA